MLHYHFIPLGLNFEAVLKFKARDYRITPKSCLVLGLGAQDFVCFWYLRDSCGSIVPRIRPDFLPPSLKTLS